MFRNMKQPRCIVLMCTNRGKIDGISYFYVTKKRHLAWLSAIGMDPNQVANDGSKCICSDHFLEKDKCYKNGKEVLKNKNAIPEVKLGPNVEYRKSLYDKPRKNIRKLANIRPAPVVMEMLSENTSNYIQIVQHENIEDPNYLTNLDMVYHEENVAYVGSSQRTIRGGPLYDANIILQDACQGDMSDMNSLPSYENRNIEDSVPPEKRLCHYLTKDPSYVKVPELMDDQIKRKTMTNGKLRTKLHCAKRGINRLKKQISHLKEVVEVLKKKDFLSDQAISELEQSYASVPVGIMKRSLKNIRNAKKGNKAEVNFLQNRGSLLRLYNCIQAKPIIT